MDAELHLRLDLKYKLNGEQLSSLKELAERAILRMLGSGDLLGESSAEIVEWHSTVAPPRNKHIVVIDERAFGVFDGPVAAKVVCPPHGDVFRLESITALRVAR